jgi:hypothetical protein
MDICAALDPVREAPFAKPFRGPITIRARRSGGRAILYHFAFSPEVIWAWRRWPVIQQAHGPVNSFTTRVDDGNAERADCSQNDPPALDRYRTMLSAHLAGDESVLGSDVSLRLHALLADGDQRNREHAPSPYTNG